MLKKYTKSTPLLAVLVAFFALSGSLFFATPASAADGKWINKSYILFESENFLDIDTTDETMVFEVNTTKAPGCRARIEVIKWGHPEADANPNAGRFLDTNEVYYARGYTDTGARAKLTRPKPGQTDANGNPVCTQTETIEIGLTDTSARKITFADKGDGTLVAVANAMTFRRTLNNPNLFRREDETEPCKDMVLLVQATALRQSEMFTPGPVSGSSIFYPVFNAPNNNPSRWSESYGEIYGTGVTCAIDNNDMTMRPLFQLFASEDINDFTARGVNTSGVAYGDGDKDDDGVIVFVGGPNNLPRDGSGATIPPGSGTTVPGSGSSGLRPTCAIDNNFGWMLCPLVIATDGVLTIIQSIIRPFLEIPPVKIDPSNALYRLWNALRNVGNVGIGIGLALIVFLQATGAGAATNLALKRTIPRLFFIAMWVNTSIFAFAFLGDIGNVATAGVRDFILGVLNQPNGIAIPSNDIGLPATGSNLIPAITLYSVGGGVLGALLAAKGIEILIAPLLIMALLILLLLAALIARMVIFYGLAAVSSPLGLLWLLPNTARIASKAMSTALQLAFIGFYIEVFFLGGQLVSTVIIASAESATGITRVVLICGAVLAKGAVILAGPMLLGAVGGLAASAGAFITKTAQRGGAAYENSRGRKLRQQAREQYKQKKFLDAAASGKGWRGKSFRAGSMLMSRGARSELNENLYNAQQKLREQRMNTIKKGVADEAGAPYSAIVAGMKKGETAEDALKRYEADRLALDPTYAKKILTGDKREKALTSIKRLQKRFGPQIGTADFMTGALMAAHATGADVDAVRVATPEVAKAVLKEKGSADEANNTLVGVIGVSAKAEGMGGLAYAGIGSDGEYHEYAIKGGSVTNDAIARGAVPGASAAAVAKAKADQAGAAKGVVDSITFEGQESGQFGRKNVAGVYELTGIGEALYTQASDPKTRDIATKRIAQALQAKNKGGTRDELIEIATRAGVINDVNRIIQGNVTLPVGGGGAPGPAPGPAGGGGPVPGPAGGGGGVPGPAGGGPGPIPPVAPAGGLIPGPAVGVPPAGGVIPGPGGGAGGAVVPPAGAGGLIPGPAVGVPPAGGVIPGPGGGAGGGVVPPAGAGGPVPGPAVGVPPAGGGIPGPAGAGGGPIPGPAVGVPPAGGVIPGPAPAGAGGPVPGPAVGGGAPAAGGARPGGPGSRGRIIPTTIPLRRPGGPPPAGGGGGAPGPAPGP